MTKSIALVVPLLALLAGCKQDPHCPALDSCGGDPTGAWVLQPGYPSCEEDLYVPPTDLRLAQNNKTPAMTAPPEPAVFDWCDQLVAGGGSMIQLHDPVFFYDSAPVAQSSVKFSKDPVTGLPSTFTASITKTGVFYMDFPAACVRQFGAADGRVINPDDPMHATGDVCKQLEYPINQGGTNSGAYFNTVCQPNPNDPQGCVCQFDVTSTGGPAGEWELTDKSTIKLISTNAVPTYATFCNKGNELELTGKDGDYLFGVRGLRTVKLAPGMQQQP